MSNIKSGFSFFSDTKIAEICFLANSLPKCVIKHCAQFPAPKILLSEILLLGSKNIRCYLDLFYPPKNSRLNNCFFTIALMREYQFFGNFITSIFPRKIDQRKDISPNIAFNIAFLHCSLSFIGMQYVLNQILHSREVCFP